MRYVGLLALFPLVTADRIFNMINNCPIPINIYVNGESVGLVKTGERIEKQYSENFSGFIYTDANGGNKDGSGTVRAGFFSERGYYYLVHDPKWLNIGVGISIIEHEETAGMCIPVRCEIGSCGPKQAYDQPPTAFPPKQDYAPPPPLWKCPWASTGYGVTFCPNGKIPNLITGARTIQPLKSSKKCLDVRGAKFANGTPVQIYDCNGTQAQKWEIVRGQQQIRVSGTNFCLDAGSNPKSGTGMKIWQCYDNLPAQQWDYLSDDTIRLHNKGKCLDLTDGVLSNGKQTQIWTCTNNNKNQVWKI